MVDTIDHYSYWNKNRQDQHFFLREKISLEVISKILADDGKFLDLGCGNGNFLEVLKAKFPKADLQGLDFSKLEVKEAKKRGLNVHWGDLGKTFKFKKEEFNVVYAGEVIEHLYDPDLFLEESNRILKKGGYLIMTTPNLCAWFNRILMPLGIQPLFLEPSTKSNRVGAGILGSMKKDTHPVGHIRIFTLMALKDLLKSNGFEVEVIRGSVYDSAMPKIFSWIDRIFSFKPSLASGFVILAKKES